MSIRKGNNIIASKPLVDAVPTQDSTNAVSSGGVYDALATKQDTISDLATIRSGAAAGATAVQPGDLATVATTGNYNDLNNKPTIPAAQVNSDWDAVSGVAQILNKPTTLSGYGITDGANTDLSNLTNTGANIGNWSHNVTNCITEIPQDIKLELNAGTLTLKAGSKVYVPNGAGVFNAVTVANDISRTSSGAAQMYVCTTSGGTSLFIGYMTGATVTTRPGTPIEYAVYYNTTTNVCETYYSGSWHQLSFPIAIITRDSSAIISIDQVFNGFGYVGSTVFALPGVKGLVPNGRNSDGTLKNTAITNESCVIATITSNGVSSIRLSHNYLATGVFPYDEKTNYNYNVTVAPENVRKQVNAGTVVRDSSVITLFKPKQAFHAVDYNDTDFIAHQAMPSDRYVDLTLPADNGAIIAPADGYVFLDKLSSAASQRIFLINDTGGKVRSCSYASASGQELAVFVPCAKGDSVRVLYNAGGTTNHFKFVYANGAK